MKTIHKLGLAAVPALAVLSGCGGHNDDWDATAAGPTFTLAVVPSSQSTAQGGSVDYTVTLTTNNGYNSTVPLSITGLPTNSEASFEPDSSLTPTSGAGASTNLEVDTASNTPTGTYHLTVSGGGQSQQVTLIVTNSSTPGPEAVIPMGIGIGATLLRRRKNRRKAQ
jgi:hypothetical protein